MLAVLSEINCLETLNRKGVYPDEFYTDVDIFKNRAVSMRDAIVLVIFAGSCRFNKRYTLEFLKTLMHREDSEQDSGIKRVYIVSDITLSGIRSYYKYTGNLDLVDIMHGWKCFKQKVDIWPRLRTEKVETVCYLSQYDSGDTEEVLKQYMENLVFKDEYADLVRVPDLQTLLKLRSATVEA